jgi:hypothetical protein
MPVMNLRAFLNATSAVLVVAASMSLGTPAAAQTQITNQSSTSLQATDPGSGSPGPHPVQINQENINFTSQEVDVPGCAQAIDQVIFQSSLNFNLILQGFPTNTFDALQLLDGLDFSKIVPLDKVPFTFAVPADPNAKVINQTAVQTSININEPGATPPAQAPDGISLTVTDISGNNVSQVNQANLNVATQVVTALNGFGSIDQAILQTSVDFNRTIVYTGQPLDLASLISGLDFVTPLQITTHHTDGPGCPTGPGAPVMDFVDQTIIQTALNFNVLNVDSGDSLPAVTQSTDDTAVQQVTVVPEPAGLALCGMGLPWLMGLRPQSKRGRG